MIFEQLCKMNWVFAFEIGLHTVALWWPGTLGDPPDSTWDYRGEPPRPGKISIFTRFTNGE